MIRGQAFFVGDFLQVARVGRVVAAHHNGQIGRRVSVLVPLEAVGCKHPGVTGSEERQPGRVEAGPQAAGVRVLQPRGACEQGRVVRVVPRAGERDGGGAARPTADDGVVPEVPQRPARSAAAGGRGDQPDMEAAARHDRGRNRLEDREGLAGEGAHELPELSFRCGSKSFWK